MKLLSLFWVVAFVPYENFQAEGPTDCPALSMSLFSSAWLSGWEARGPVPGRPAHWRQVPHPQPRPQPLACAPSLTTPRVGSEVWLLPSQQPLGLWWRPTGILIIMTSK